MVAISTACTCNKGNHLFVTHITNCFDKILLHARKLYHQHELCHAQRSFRVFIYYLLMRMKVCVRSELLLDMKRLHHSTEYTWQLYDCIATQSVLFSASA